MRRQLIALVALLVAGVHGALLWIYYHPEARGLLGDERRYWEQLSWVGIVTLAYLPASVAPVGLSSDGLPVGIQIIAPYLEDRTAIDFARRLGGIIGGYEPPPGFS